ncbi:MAG: PEP/pyruvate-binding domain-containing protein, partial [Candidatus Peregrinibacteria bacterium]
HANKFLKRHLEKFSIIIQEYIEPDISGITFTRNPTNSRELTIEYHHGRGEDIVSGKVKPQNFQTYHNYNADNLPLPNLKETLKTFKKIEKHFNFPQDIEWCIKDKVWYFLQTRPITTITKEDYQTHILLDSLLPKNEKFFYEKTEISEIAPTPTPPTLDLLKKIYAENGPVHKVYEKYNIEYTPLDFIKIIDKELYIDREKEIQTLLPSYSYLKSDTFQPKLARLKGLFKTLKNIYRINHLPQDNYDDLFTKLKQKLTSPPSKNFLEDYELVFEINLLAEKAIQNLTRSATSPLPSLLTDPLPEFTLTPPKNLQGNSLEIADITRFIGNVSTTPRYSTPPPTSPLIKTANIYNRLREYGRWLVVKNINELRKNTRPLPKIPVSKHLPKSLTHIPLPTQNLKPTGISHGAAEGILLDEKSLNFNSSPNKILYTKLLTPNLTKYFPKIKGIVSEEGGLLSHLAIMARESHIPVVTNFNLNISSKKLGDNVKIDGNTGEVI